MDATRNVYRILEGKLVRKRPLVRLLRRECIVLKWTSGKYIGKIRIELKSFWIVSSDVLLY